MDFIPGVDGEGIPRVLACFMHALMTGAPLQLVDGGRQRRSFLDVGEFVTAIVRLLERPQACSGADLQPRQPAQRRQHPRSSPARSRRRTGRRGRRKPAPRLESVSAEAFYGPGYDDTAARIPSMAKAARLLGWRPRRTLAEMLPAIVGDYLARYAPIPTARARVAAAAGRSGR